ncbi:Fe(3+)-dicitrate ABC transporter ATP-binding protein [Rhodobacteraceae bacterium WD3A24]|nr:Fe(3+)-dicitrate ABC transporter ATP-binding protein [Rhodobacteraceae bacterium WD3A24]
MPEALARLSDVTAGYEGHLVFDGLDLTIPAGQVVALCGPNGSGKSTALRVMRRLITPQSGAVEAVGKPLGDWGAKDLARQIAMLSQSPDAPDELRVRDLVMLGRFPHRRAFRGPAQQDHDAVEQALRRTEMSDLGERPIAALSGGQLQRAWIAMVLAQEAPAILLDEPTNHLDLAHSLEILELLRSLNREEGRSFVVVLHDLNMAARYADHIVMFRAGRVAASGATGEVMTEEIIARVFGIDCSLFDHPLLGCPIVVPLASSNARGP